MTSRLRIWLTRFLYTPNTIRYRVEWRRLREALRVIGPVQHLFDGGAGSGEFARKALLEGWCKQVTALEYDAGNFTFLRDKLGNDPRAEIRQGNCWTSPFRTQASIWCRARRCWSISKITSAPPLNSSAC